MRRVRTTGVACSVAVAAVVAAASVVAPGVAHAKPARVDLAKLVRLVASTRSSALTVARAFGVRARTAAALVLHSEPLDKRYPALSLPSDLPKADYPNRAVVARRVRLFGRPTTARVLSELAVIRDRKRRVALLGSRKARLIVMLTLDAKTPRRAVPLARVERALHKLGAHTLGSGRLGVCGNAKPWCYSRALLVRARKGHYRVHIHLELSRSAHGGKARVRGIKLVRWP